MVDERLMLLLEESEALLADGFDDALVGSTAPDTRAVYDGHKMLQVLINRDGMSYDDAMEYLYHNVFDSHVGERGPIYIWMADE